MMRVFFSPGGLLHKQGPRRSRIRGDPLPHSHNTLVVTSCLLQEGQVGNQETPHNTEHLPLFSRGGLGASQLESALGLGSCVRVS